MSRRTAFRALGPKSAALVWPKSRKLHLLDPPPLADLLLFSCRDLDFRKDFLVNLALLAKQVLEHRLWVSPRRRPRRINPRRRRPGGTQQTEEAYQHNKRLTRNGHGIPEPPDCWLHDRTWRTGSHQPHSILRFKASPPRSGGLGRFLFHASQPFGGAESSAASGRRGPTSPATPARG